MSRRQAVLVRLTALLATAGLVLGGCSTGGNPTATTATALASTDVAPDDAARAPAPSSLPRPERGTCRVMTYAQALAPVDASTEASCRSEHTAETFAIGELRTVRAGHLVAVDSPTVQRQPARTCPQRLQQHLGGSQEDVRLSMLRTIWFTPTVEESDAGATWFRCDVVVLDGDDDLAPVRIPLEDVLAQPAGRDRFGMCGTAEPGSPDFRRTLCRAPHTWRALSAVDLLDEAPAARRGTPAYPGLRVVREAGQQVCDERGREVADDALDYQWGYEWPTAEQWATGQTYGRCWAPVP